MKHRIYSIYDSKSESYSQPFQQMTDGQASRTYADMVNNPEHPIGKHSEDYTLFFIGQFDDQNGNIEPLTPIAIGNGMNFKETQVTEFPSLNKE